MGPFPPSGKKFQVDFGAVFRMAQGKIAEWWVTWDNTAMLAQLGHLPTLPSKNG
jgi:predicted ester cyclase